MYPYNFVLRIFEANYIPSGNYTATLPNDVQTFEEYTNEVDTSL